VLATLGHDHGMPAADVEEQRALAQRFRAGVAASTDPATGLARDRDLRAGAWLASETVAGFAPLLCGGLDPDSERDLLRLLDSQRWCGHPSLLAAVPPTTSPLSPAFRPREYWRGPQWPVLVWLLGWAFARRGWTDRAADLRAGGLRLLEDGTFAEYYEPFTGEPLGGAHQSWTAAAALDWLC
jgi:glucosylglycerate hydrolase